MPSSRARATSRSKSSSVPSSGWTRGVPALGAADRPRAARVARLGRQRVVPALAVRDADRVDRRQVDDVEAELGELRQHVARRPRSRPTSAGRARTRSRSARARGRRRPRAAATEVVSLRSAWRRRRAPRATVSDSRPYRAARPRRARSQVLLAARRPCARSRRRQEATRSTHASIRERASGRPVDLELARPAVVARRARAAPPASGRAGRLVADGGAEHLVPVAEDRRAQTSTRSPTVRSSRVAAAVDLRPTSWIWMRAAVLRSGGACLGSVSRSSPKHGVNLAALERRPAAPDLAARRAARRAGVRVRRLARGGRPVLVAGAAARPAGRRRLAVPSASAFAGWSGLLAEPDAPGRARGARGFRRARTRTGSATGPRSPARTRSPTRCASSASGARCASTRRQRGVRLIGDLPIYVAAGGADHVSHPELFSSERSRASRPTTSRRDGQLWGNPLYDWPALRARRATAGGSSASGARSSSSTSRASTTSAASSPTGRSRPARRRRGSGRWRRGPGRELFDAVRERARRAAGDRRGPRA